MIHKTIKIFINFHFVMDCFGFTFLSSPSTFICFHTLWLCWKLKISINFPLELKSIIKYPVTQIVRIINLPRIHAKNRCVSAIVKSKQKKCDFPCVYQCLITFWYWVVYFGALLGIHNVKIRRLRHWTFYIDWTILNEFQ